MEVYIPMIIATLILSWVAVRVRGERNKKIVYGLSLLPSVIVAALRYNNGADYLMYLRMMKTYAVSGTWVDSFTSVKDIEIGFVVLLKFLNFLTQEYFLIFGIIALLIGAFVFAGIWTVSDYVVLSVYLFFAAGIYFDTFNGLRQFLAISIIFYAFQYLLKGNFRKYCIWVLFAALFHYSAVIMIPVYFIRKLDISLKQTIVYVSVLVLGSGIIFRVLCIVLQYTRYAFFLNSVEFEIIPTEASILYTSVISVVAFAYRELKSKQASDQMRIMYNYQLLVWCSTLLSLSIPLASRLQEYFLVYEIIFIPAFLVNVKRENIRLLLGIMFVLMYTVITVWGMQFNGWYTSIPYNYYFDFM